mmetsp:Transcript_848/g.1945  ORF Transcript_848/g.1945 Transcript_848/m.1945 type:complete len:221 (+) Transcript_848:300-962(+)
MEVSPGAVRVGSPFWPGLLQDIDRGNQLQQLRNRENLPLTLAFTQEVGQRLQLLGEFLGLAMDAFQAFFQLLQVHTQLLCISSSDRIHAAALHFIMQLLETLFHDHELGTKLALAGLELFRLVRLQLLAISLAKAELLSSFLHHHLQIAFPVDLYAVAEEHDFRQGDGQQEGGAHADQRRRHVHRHLQRFNRLAGVGQGLVGLNAMAEAAEEDKQGEGQN